MKNLSSPTKQSSDKNKIKAFIENIFDKNQQNPALAKGTRKYSDNHYQSQKDGQNPSQLYVEYEETFEKQSSREQFYHLMTEKFKAQNSFEIKEDRIQDFRELIQILIIYFRQSQNIVEFHHIVQILRRVYYVEPGKKKRIYLRQLINQRYQVILQNIDYWLLLFGHLEETEQTDKTLTFENSKEQ